MRKRRKRGWRVGEIGKGAEGLRKRSKSAGWKGRMKGHSKRRERGTVGKRNSGVSKRRIKGIVKRGNRKGGGRKN